MFLWSTRHPHILLIRLVLSNITQLLTAKGLFKPRKIYNWQIDDIQKDSAANIIGFYGNSERNVIAFGVIFK